MILVLHVEPDLNTFSSVLCRLRAAALAKYHPLSSLFTAVAVNVIFEAHSSQKVDPWNVWTNVFQRGWWSIPDYPSLKFHLFFFFFFLLQKKKKKKRRIPYICLHSNSMVGPVLWCVWADWACWTCRTRSCSQQHLHFIRSAAETHVSARMCESEMQAWPGIHILRWTPPPRNISSFFPHLQPSTHSFQTSPALPLCLPPSIGCRRWL